MKQPTLSLRLGTEDDANIVVDFSRSLFDLSPYSVVSEFNSKVVWDNYLASLSMPKFEFITMILCDKEKPVGFMSCGSNKGQFSEDRYAVEVGFFILPEYKSLSAVKLLLSAFHYWAKESDCKAAFVGKIKDRKIETYKMKVLV